MTKQRIEEMDDGDRGDGDEGGGCGDGDDDGGWKELMGGDLIMRVDRDGSGDGVGGDAGGGEGAAAPAPPEYGDVVRIDISGYVLGPDDLFSPAPDGGGDGDGETSSPLETFRLSEVDGNAAVVAGDTGHCFLRESDVLVTLGDGIDVPPAAEMGIRYLRPNEVGVVRCMSKYAHGSKGLPSRKKTKDGAAAGAAKDGGDDTSGGGSHDVPPFAAVEFRITIGRIIPPNEFTAELNTERALRRKAAGNDLFARGGDLDRSLRLYLSAAKIASGIVDDLAPGEGDEAKAAKAASDTVGLLVDCRNNAALVHLKMGNHKQCKDACTEVLQLDPHNVKTLCRAARSSIALGEYGEAETCLDAAEESAGGDVAMYMDVRRVRTALKAARVEYLRKERERYEGKVVKKGVEEVNAEKGKGEASPPKGFASATLLVRISSLLVFFLAFGWAWWVRREEETRLFAARADDGQ